MVSRAYWVIVASLFIATRVLAQSVAPGSGAWSPALARASAATVTLEVQGVCCNVGGSGVLLTGTGLIATSARVIQGARRVRVWLSTGEMFDAVGALYYDHRLDLALIRIPGVGFPSAPTANSDSLMVGQRLVAIGVPPDQLATVTDGLLSAVRTEDGVRRLRLSVPIPLSSSGGPIVNEQGKVVGLVEMAYAEMAYERIAAPSPGDLPIGVAAGIARTNPALDLDFRPLSGVSLFFEEQYAGQLRVRDRTGYILSLSPGGNLALERTNRREWWDQAASDSLAEQELRTIYGIGNSDRSFSAYTLRPLVSSIPTVSWELHIEGGQYRYSSAEGVREGEATPGIVPREMLSAILAALPDSLPPEVHVSVLDAVENRYQEVIVRFGRHESRRIPVPRDGG